MKIFNFIVIFLFLKIASSIPIINRIDDNTDNYFLTGTRYVKIEDSKNSYQVTSSDSVNQGMNNILQPIISIGDPNIRLN